MLRQGVDSKVVRSGEVFWNVGEVGDRAPTRLPFRDALNEWNEVASDLVADYNHVDTCDVTIAITTYRRADFLLDAIKSALAQDFAGSVEIIVVDNEPSSSNIDGILDKLPEVKNHSFKYYVHRANMGMFGNFNRAIRLASGTWLTILNDDDLLDKDCLRALVGQLQRSPEVDGIICSKRFLDQRADVDGKTDLMGSSFAGQRMSLKLLARYVADAQLRGELAKRLLGRLVAERYFLGRRTRRLRAKSFFWGNIVGNGVGFVFDTKKAAAMGGFYAEEFPSSDHFFFARFASRFHLRQHREVKASFRFAANESAKPSTILTGIEKAHELQRLMLGFEVPRWWHRFIPMTLAHFQHDARKMWNVPLSTQQVREVTGVEIPDQSPRTLFLARFLFSGF